MSQRVLQLLGGFQTRPYWQNSGEVEYGIHFSSLVRELERFESCYNPPMKSLRDAGTQTEIRERLSRVTPDAPRLWGRMNARQMVCHLADSFRAVLGERPLQMVKTPMPRKIMKFIALEVPMPWPHDLKTGAEIDQLIGGTPPAEFAADMTGLGTLFQRFVSDPGAIAVIHPFFGTMSERDWLRWGYLHMDHHLRQFGK